MSWAGSYAFHQPGHLLFDLAVLLHVRATIQVADQVAQRSGQVQRVRSLSAEGADLVQLFSGGI